VGKRSAAHGERRIIIHSTLKGSHIGPEVVFDPFRVVVFLGGAIRWRRSPAANLPPATVEQACSLRRNRTVPRFGTAPCFASIGNRQSTIGNWKLAIGNEPDQKE